MQKVPQWCQETGLKFNSSNAKGLRCATHNKVARKAMPTVCFSEEATERTNRLGRYLLIYFDRMLTHKTQVYSTKLKLRKRLSVLKALAAKGIQQRHVSLLYLGVIFGVIDSCLGVAPLLKSNPLKLNTVEKEVILRTIRDTPLKSCDTWRKMTAGRASIPQCSAKS